MAFSEKLSFYVICEMNLVKFLNGYGVNKQACKVVCHLVGSLTMAIGVVEFSREGYKIRKDFA